MSNYPQALDTSRELPLIRDNITEIGSEAINSIRDAIIKIEQTLGINPHGAAGQTVSSRISTSLDSNGNIRKEALTAANVLSGPILDVDVSSTAAISESKLRLNFPTQVLQDEISILNNELTSIANQIEYLNSIFSVHIYPGSTNRHNATAITVESFTTAASASSLNDIDVSTNLQTVIEDITNRHINFAGSVSSINKSHDASQIYVDISNIGDVVFKNNVQGAIEDLANIESVRLRNNTLNLASNGRIRTGSTYDAYENNNLGSMLLESSPVSFLREESRTRFTFDSVQTPLSTVAAFDYFILSNAHEDADNRSYQIAEVVYSSGDITEVVVFGVPIGNSITGLTGSISKNPYVTYNGNGLNATVLPRINKTNTPDIILSNPNSATIISDGIQVSKIVSSENTFNITIDDGSAITIETYDSSVTEQTIDSVVNKINEQSVDQHLSFIAFKIKIGNTFELALSHILPNIEGDVKNRTLKIEAGSSDDGTSILGFTSILGTEFEGNFGNTYHINGYLYNAFGKVQSFLESDISLIAGSNTISLYSESFISKGIRVGDIVVVTGSSSSSDDGMYRISNLSESAITMDDLALAFAGNITESGIIHILRVSANIDEMTFSEIMSIDGSIVFDVFTSEEQDIHYHKRLEVDGAISNGAFSAVVSDVSRGFIASGEMVTLTVQTDGYAYLTDQTLTDGDYVYVGHSGSYRILASDGMSFITISVKSSGPPAVEQTVDIYGFGEVNTGNLKVCRGTFSTSLGRVLGEYAGAGVPSIIDKRRSGTVDETIISESLIEKYIEGPRNELRSNGVVRGLSVSNAIINNIDGYQEVDIDAGIVIVNGIRYEIPGYISYRFNTDQNFYIGVDKNGCIIHSSKVSNPSGYTDGNINEIADFFDQNVAYIAFVDSVASSITDLRFFIDKLDLKSGRIIVSKTQNFGHFTSVSSAVEYAKIFTELYPNQGTPQIFIDQGNYEISNTIVVDFDVQICGSGPGTMLTKTGAFAQGTAPSSGNIDFGDTLFLIGSTSEEGSLRIENGVTLSNFTYQTSGDLTAVGCVISITHPIIKSASPATIKATFRIRDINFIGTDSISYGAGVDADMLGEYAIAIGQTNTGTFVPETGITMGNIIVTECRFDKMGVEKGAIIFSESSGSTFRDIIISNNIATELSPNEGDTSFEILQTSSTPTLTRIVETNNTRS